MISQSVIFMVLRETIEGYFRLLVDSDGTDDDKKVIAKKYILR